MQSGYGVPEIQQLMVDSCCSSLLSISHEISHHPQKHLQQLQQQHQQQFQLHQQQQQQRFHPFHPIPFTQNFFQQQQQFQAFQQHQQRRLLQQVGLDQDTGPPDGSNSPSRVVVSGGGSSPFLAANFKLAVSENSSGHDPMLGGGRGGEDGSKSRAASAVAVLPWQQREEDSGIKEPLWKPLDIELINRNNKRCKESIESPSKYSKKGEEGNDNEEGKSSGSNYGLYGELEAIYAHGSGGNNTQTGSGSALTGDNPPLSAVPMGPSGQLRSSGIDHGSETSTGEEASLKKLKLRRKKKRKQLSSIATFFETLVKQLMDHQESLHKKFMEVMEKKDKERTDREEEWRRLETAKANREAIARAQEQALAYSREAAIVAFLEKITGESINLPTTAKTQFQFQLQLGEESNKEEIQVEISTLKNSNNETLDDNIINSNKNNNNNSTINLNARRWPKAEVQALIRVRSSLESRFQEPGLKGPLWEEVSNSMAVLGYQRSAKRCKEKWENINKYFRKTKDSAKKRSQHSKTCPYFQQLDQLYSKSKQSIAPTPSIVEQKDNSELLDAIVVVPLDLSKDPTLEFVQEQLGLHPSFKFHEMGSERTDFGSTENDKGIEVMSSKAGKELFGFVTEEEREDEEDEDYEEEDDGDEEGENPGNLQE